MLWISQSLRFAILPICLALCVFLARGADTPAQSRPAAGSRFERLKNAKTWMYLIDDVSRKGAIEELANTGYDLIVLEPTNTLKGDEDWDSKGAVQSLRAARPGRIVLAYVSVAEAESYRTYWQADWKTPTKDGPGVPAFLLMADPDGWSEDYPAAYWDPQWRDIAISGKDSLLRKALADGYDGIYMDWVGAYEEPKVKAAAKKAGIDNPAQAMVDFILELRETARKEDPEFLVVAQNAPDLLDEDPRYAKAIDGVGAEDICFRGKANAKWDSPKGGDIANRYKDESSTARWTEQYQKYLKAGLPVFTVDYCVNEDNARMAYEVEAKAGFVPLVTRVSLARLTTTPPPALGK
ncbi:MAG: endo alpha-1,4 polygalactosaminidase [Candidatus Sumerlaeota bacterium]|nr:endo alpha-1,4 polygalactosaminidase [Candidatus Sumerlaeota bacterium]